MNFNDIEDYADYYASQLIIQYRNKPKAYETIKALARHSFINFSNIGKWRSLDDATGDALLAIAELFGIYGFYDGIDLSNKYFALTSYNRNGLASPNQEGFQDYKNPKEGHFLRYSDFQNNLSVAINLSDKDLRGIIRIRALYFSNDLSSKSIQNALDKYFEGCYISESFNPPILFYHIGIKYDKIFAMLFSTGFILKPAGVGVLITRA